MGQHNKYIVIELRGQTNPVDFVDRLNDEWIHIYLWFKVFRGQYLYLYMSNSIRLSALVSSAQVDVASVIGNLVVSLSRRASTRIANPIELKTSAEDN